ncbi:hypothetical protein KP509_15G054200 [Ceratopteris richardii]|uniref:non-specific serine/threonine protein kinase n=1 Tax=Ceratopteris richardii TaxID=49495 RepID=A0A8T2T4M3_CERRI|nr:hypothetical protein KP509_15G054200 [Ceratopteris richardii]KAH7405034.1 hypothetical protein KP509_15G054200 [Ceratopteris richardii]
MGPLIPKQKSCEGDGGLHCIPSFACGLFTWPSSSARVVSASGINADVSRRDRKEENELSSQEPAEDVPSFSPPRKFQFSELKSATRNFRPNSLIGEGGFGHVFKGWIDEHGTAPAKPGTGMVVAVKILKTDGPQGHKEWLAEVDYLGELHHPNLVHLIGYCNEGENRLLVYEFMEYGSLDQHLFRKARPLPWRIRMKIALDAAKGLAFLHDRNPPIIFRDLKTSNILLDCKYNAKLSDFGLAREGPIGGRSHVSTRIVGTYGYAAPEYVMTGHLTARSDIYSFGVVLLELLTGKRSMDASRPSGQHNLVEWTRPFLSDRKRVTLLVDPNLNGVYSPRGVHKLSSLAARCLSRDPRVRPSMQQVVDALTLIQNFTDMVEPVTPVASPLKDVRTKAKN